MDINNILLNKGPKIFENRISGERRYISVKNLALFLDVSEHTIRKWIVKKTIPYIRVNDSNTIRFDMFEIQKWINPCMEG